LPDNHTITFEDYKKVAAELGVETAAVIAVSKVEAPKGPFLASGLPPILFEGHVFWKELKKLGIDPKKYTAETYKGKYRSVLYQSWTKAYYIGGEREYGRLELASEIHHQAALKSASWGAFQIMGFNHAAAGYKTIDGFVEAMKHSAASQLRAFIHFIKANPRMYNALKNKKWEIFAESYNGSGYKQNAYDTKLAAEYKKAVKLVSESSQN
jgi:hypothetical protein